MYILLFFRCIFHAFLYTLFYRGICLASASYLHPNQLCDLSKQQISLKLNFLTLKMGFNIIYIPMSEGRFGGGVNKKVQVQCQAG